MIGCLVGLALFADADNYAGTFEASNRTEFRPRYTEGEATPAIDLVDVATARLDFSDRVWEHYIQYTPVLTLPYLFDFNSNVDEPLLLHAASIATSWHDRRVRLQLSEDGNYGQENATLLTATTTGAPTGSGSSGSTPAAQINSAQQTITFGYSRTALYSDVQFSPRLRGSLLVSYLIQGGLDQGSRTLFPFQNGPRAEATLGWSATRVDTAETHLVGQISESKTGECPELPGEDLTKPLPTNCDPAVQFAFATEAWRKRFAGDVEGSIGVGVTLAQARLHATDTYAKRTWPVLEAWLEKSYGRKEHRRSLRMDVDVEPVVDVRTAALDYRATLTAIGTIPLQDDNALRLQVWGIQSIDSVILAPLTLFRAEAEIEHFYSPWLSYGGGVRVEWEHEDPFGSFYTLLALAQVTLRVPTVKF